MAHFKVSGDAQNFAIRIGKFDKGNPKCGMQTCVEHLPGHSPSASKGHHMKKALYLAALFAIGCSSAPSFQGEVSEDQTTQKLTAGAIHADFKANKVFIDFFESAPTGDDLLKPMSVLDDELWASKKERRKAPNMRAEIRLEFKPGSSDISGAQLKRQEIDINYCKKSAAWSYQMDIGPASTDTGLVNLSGSLTPGGKIQGHFQHTYPADQNQKAEVKFDLNFSGTLPKT